MEVRKLTKEEIGEKVLFPRTQLAGISCENKDTMPAREEFTLETIHNVPGMGEARLIVQTEEPRMVFQLIEASDENQFDDYLGKLLGMHYIPSYIEERTDFMVLFRGSQSGQEINQQNQREVYLHICHTRDQAARWYHLYGSNEQMSY